MRNMSCLAAVSVCFFLSFFCSINLPAQTVDSTKSGIKSFEEAAAPIKYG